LIAARAGDVRGSTSLQASHADTQGNAKAVDKRGEGETRLVFWISLRTCRSPYLGSALILALLRQSRRHECRRLVLMLGSDCSNVSSFLAFAAWGHVELDLLALIERLVAASLNVGVVDEYILALLTRDEAEALLGVEESYSSCCQCFSFLCASPSI
jgi:hypothetical protein